MTGIQIQKDYQYKHLKNLYINKSIYFICLVNMSYSDVIIKKITKVKMSFNFGVKSRIFWLLMCF